MTVDSGAEVVYGVIALDQGIVNREAWVQSPSTANLIIKFRSTRDSDEIGSVA
jgi:hypothetical protein